MQLSLFSHGKYVLQHGMSSRGRVRPMMTLRNMVTLLGLIPSLAALQRVFDIGHPCYGQLTPVKTRYPLTSIT